MRLILTVSALACLPYDVGQAQPVKYGRIFLPLTVVATGDSHTVGYTAGGKFQTALNARFPGRYDSDPFAIGRTDSPEYVGILPAPGTEALIDYTSEVLAMRPDVVVFMLGTNDAWHDANGRGYFDQFTANVPTFLDRYVASGAKVIVANPPPVLPLDGDPDNAEIDRWLLESYQPFLQQITSDRHIPLVDLQAAIQLQPDYETLLFRQTNRDGIHLSAAGYEFIAGEIADAVVRHAIPFRRRFRKRSLGGLPVPEPSTEMLAALAVIGFPRRRPVHHS